MPKLELNYNYIDRVSPGFPVNFTYHNPSKGVCGPSPYTPFSFFYTNVLTDNKLSCSI